MSPVSGRLCRWGRRHWSRGMLILSAVVVLLVVPSPPSTSVLEADFPHHTPDQLAHFLADFTNHPKFYTHIGSWVVEEERSNLSWWRYVVVYDCGSLCSGRVQLDHHVHTDTSEHRVVVRDELCSRLPVMGWPQLCEDTLTDTSVREGPGDGARLTQRRVTRCVLLGSMTRACGTSDHQQHVQDVRRALAGHSLH